MPLRPCRRTAALIAYATDASGSLELHVRSRLANGPTRAVTDNGGDNVEPAWSPDAPVARVSLAAVRRRLAGSGGRRTGSPTGGRRGLAELVARWSIDRLPDGRGSRHPGRTGWVTVHARRSSMWPPARSSALTRRGDPPGSHGSPVWLPGSRQRSIFVAARVPAAEVWQVTRGGRADAAGRRVTRRVARSRSARRDDMGRRAPRREGRGNSGWRPWAAMGDVDMTPGADDAAAADARRDRRQRVPGRHADGVHERRADERGVGTRLCRTGRIGGHYAARCCSVSDGRATASSPCRPTARASPTRRRVSVTAPSPGCTISPPAPRVSSAPAVGRAS